MTKPAKEQSGQLQKKLMPSIIAAVLCDRVLIEADGVVSAIRIIDRITVTGAVEVFEPDKDVDVSKVSLPDTIRLELLLMVRGLPRIGEAFLAVQPYGPDHEPLGSEVTTPIQVSEPLFGGNAQLSSRLTVYESGVHYLSVRYGGRELTRVSFQYVDQRTRRRITDIGDATPGVTVFGAPQ